MTLIKCTECGKKISDQAKVCISCGAPILPSAPQKTSENIKYGVPRYPAMLVLMFGAIFIFTVGQETSDAVVPALLVSLIVFNTIWHNVLGDKTRRRKFFSFSEFFSVPSALQKQKRNIWIFSIGSALFLLMASAAINEASSKYEEENAKIISTLFDQPHPTAVASTSTLQNILQTHPWICIGETIKNECEYISNYVTASEAEYKIETTGSINSAGELYSVRQTTYSSLADGEICSKISDNRNKFEVLDADNQHARELERISRRLEEGIISAGGTALCEVFYNINYDTLNDVYFGFRAETFDTSNLVSRSNEVFFLSNKPDN